MSRYDNLKKRYLDSLGTDENGRTLSAYERLKQKYHEGGTSNSYEELKSKYFGNDIDQKDNETSINKPLNNQTNTTTKPNDTTTTTPTITYERSQEILDLMNSDDFKQNYKKGYDQYLADSKAEANDRGGAPDWVPDWLILGLEMGAKSGSGDALSSNMTSVAYDYRHDDSYKNPTDEWSQEDKDIFGYYYLTDKNKAFQFAEETNNRIAKAKTEAQKKEVGESATGSAGGVIGHNLARIPAQMTGLADYLDNAIEYIARGTITQKDTLTPYDYSVAVRDATIEKLNENGTISEDVPIFGGKGWGDVYGLGTSIVDSAVNATVGGGIGAGIIGFGSASASGIDDALERGATDEQALLLGTVNGLAEAFAEGINADKLLGVGASKTFKEFVTNTLKLGVSEGIEETATSFANNVADNLIMQDKSTFNIYVDELMANNPSMSREDAIKKAWVKSVEDIAYDALSGFLSGGVHGGGATAIQTTVGRVQSGKTIKNAGQTRTLVDTAKALGSDSKAAKAANKITDKSSAYAIGKLYGLTETEISNANRTDIVKSLERKGIDAKQANRIAELMLDSENSLYQNSQGFTKEGKTYNDLIKNPNSTVNARSQGLENILRGVAEQRAKAEISKGSAKVSSADNSGFALLSKEEVSKRMADNPAFAKEYTEWAKINSSEGSLSPFVKNTAESRFKASEEGEAINTETGKTINIAEIASIKGKEMMLKTDNGETVNAKNVSYANEGDALVYSAVLNMGVPAGIANELVRGYKGKDEASAISYVNGMEEAFRFGTYNYPLAEVANGIFSKELSPEQRDTAYKLGKIYANEKVIKEQESIIAKGKGVATKKIGKVNFNGDKLSLTEIQKSSVEGLNVLAMALGKDINIFESYVDKSGRRVYKDANGVVKAAPNGFYNPKDGSIWIDLNAGNFGQGTMMYTIAHELSHFIKQWSPVKFKALADFLVEQYGEKGVSVDTLVRRQMQKAKNNDGTISYDVAFEEMVADSMESMLTDGKVIKELYKRDKGLFNKIKSWVDNLIRKLNSAYKGYAPESKEGRFVTTMKDSFKEIQTLFTDALRDASSNFANADAKAQKNTTQEGDVKLQTRIVNGNEIVWVEQNILKENKGMPIHSFVANFIAEHIGEAYTIIESGQKVFIGKDLPNEYTQSKYTRAILKNNPNIVKVKNRASANLGEMIEIATNRRWEKTEHEKTKDAKYGMYRYDTRFGFPVMNTKKEVVGANVFTAELVIRNASDGKKYLYDIVAIKKDIVSSDWLTKKATSATVKTVGQKNNIFSNSISNPIENVKENSEKQSARDVAYIDAVNRGDAKAAQKLVDEAAKRAGYTQKVYHGTDSEFTEFNTNKQRTSGKLNFGKGIYLTPNKNLAEMYTETGNVMELYASVKNPYEIFGTRLDNADLKKLSTEFGESVTLDNIDKVLQKNGYDGIIARNYNGSTNPINQIVVFSSNQVKSADPITYDDKGAVIPLSERFNSEKNDIRYSDRNIAQYTEKQYNDFGWATYNNVISPKERQILFSRYADYKHNNNKYPTTRFGEAVIHSDDCPDIIMYIKGDISSPQITKIIKIISDDDVDVFLINERIVDNEFKQISLPFDAIEAYYGPEVLDFKYKRDYASFQEYKSEQERRNSEKLDTYSREQQNRGRSFEENQNGDEQSEWIKKSDRDANSTSVRSLLVNSLEGTAQNEIEKNKLNEYKKKISLIEAEQKKLTELRAEIKELSFAKGPRDTKKISKLQNEAIKTANRINIYDRQLLSLEATKPLQNVLNREKELAKKKQKQKDEEILKAYKEKVANERKETIEHYKESRKKAVEGRNKTEMRHKIKKVVNDLNKLLLKGTKEKHVMVGLQKAVAAALDAINMDTVSADERVAKYDALIAKETNPEIIASLTESRDRIQSQGDKLSEKLSALKDAYNEIKNSTDESVNSQYDEIIFGKIESVQKKVGTVSLRNMTLEQLQEVYDLYTMVLTSVRNSNKAFAEDIKITRMQLGSNTLDEIKDAHKAREYIGKVQSGIEKFMWQNMKPMTAMKTIGSGTLQKLWNNILYGQEVFAKDYYEAVEFAKTTKEKYGYHKWDLKKTYSFDTKSGKMLKLNLEQMMSIYAYSKRRQADDHIEKGGFVLNENVIEVKNKLGVTTEVKVNDSNAYRLSKEQVGEIVETLEKVAPGARAFVEEMQKYLSETMGAKGNEVSRKMYGIDLFKETHYFPLKSSKEFMEAANTKLKGDVKIKNKGMTKSVVEHASNPVVLENFLDVWGNHINEMSLYHGLVLPLEDFSRTLNYAYRADNETNTDAESVKTALHDAFGDNAEDYINNLLKHINGGVLHDSTAGFSNKLLSKFKKGSVMASLSVVVQQPTAIIRAMGIIEPKYFVAQNFNHKTTWEELKKYCPTAIIKETGSFDTNMGRSIVEMVKDDGKFKLDDALAKAPAYMDEMGWNMIWRALKKKIATEQDISGEALLEACGKEMTIIINETQVYDSVMSRSELMRSKDTLSKMATSFMAEPTTVSNMVYSAMLDFKRGKKSIAGKTVAAVISSIVVNGLVSSMIYALRDDDEDETLLEKYLQSATTEIVDGLNPITYIPYLKDIYSIFQGYDVARTDMSMFANVNNALKTFEKIFDAEAYKDMSKTEVAKYVYDNTSPLVGSICNLFGLPVKNVLRDVEAILINDNLSMSQTTGAGTKSAIKEGAVKALPEFIQRMIGTDTKTDKLYNAIVSGDKTQIERITEQYKDRDAINAAIRTALRENDSRIKDAAQARYEGDFNKYAFFVREIVAEGHFSQDLVVGAVNTELNSLKKSSTSESTEETEDTEENKATSIYSSSDFNVAFENGDKTTALQIINDIVRVKTENYITEGYSKTEAEKKAKSSARSSMTSYWKPLYIDAYNRRDNAEMIRIRNILNDSRLYSNTNTVVKTVQQWVKDSKKTK